MIHESAIVSKNATIHEGVSIGAFSIVHDNVVIGAGSRIEAFCELGLPTPLGDGSPLQIGPNSLIRSHSCFYESSKFGSRLVTGHRVTVRERTTAGENLQIGTLSDIQGTCNIGHYVRLHSNVHIGQHSTIEDFVWIFPYVVLTNDPHPPSEVRLGVTVREFAAIATMSVILPGVTIGRDSLVGAHSSVTRDVPEGAVVAGVPAKFVCDARNIKLRDGAGDPAYPWRKHFQRGYPDTIVSVWKDSDG